MLGILLPLLFQSLELFADAPAGREARVVEGWTMQVACSLLESDRPGTEHAIDRMREQLALIRKVVPAVAVSNLQKVTLWVSPKYSNTGHKAEYHPDPNWLRNHGRDPVMARGVEFTNTKIVDDECRRMPVYVLHELAHAYHHQVLGYGQRDIRAAFEAAKASGKYDNVKRRDARGRESSGRAYAMTNDKEYFAETTEAFFGTNDIFPFTRDELQQHDPEMFALLARLWGCGEKETKR